MERRAVSPTAQLSSQGIRNLGFEQPVTNFEDAEIELNCLRQLHLCKLQSCSEFGLL